MLFVLPCYKHTMVISVWDPCSLFTLNKDEKHTLVKISEQYQILTINRKKYLETCTLYMGLFTKLGNVCGILYLIPCNLKLLFIKLFSTRTFYLRCQQEASENHRHIDPCCVLKIIPKNPSLDVTAWTPCPCYIHNVLFWDVTAHP